VVTDGEDRSVVSYEAKARRFREPASQLTGLDPA